MVAAGDARIPQNTQERPDVVQYPWVGYPNPITRDYCAIFLEALEFLKRGKRSF